ncbi:MAG: Clp protease N-terminal domain-containing protein [Candidatus Paceibacterota bacterium]
MLHYSIGVQLAWEISSYEASNKKSPLIEVDHIMLGILSLEKIEEDLRKKPKIDFNNFLFEKNKLYKTLENYAINIDFFRRSLRNILPLGTGLPVDNIFHRSTECKNLFNASIQFSNNYITINGLFLAIIGWNKSQTRNLLLKDNVDIEKLKTDILFSFYKNN